MRTYGISGPIVIVLHGGPGAAGYLAPLARGLAESFRVLEPFHLLEKRHCSLRRKHMGLVKKNQQSHIVPTRSHTTSGLLLLNGVEE